MKVTIIPQGLDNYCYILFCPISGEIGLVDCSDATPVFNWLQKQEKQLRWVLNTHHHADHVSGNDALLEAFPDVVFYGFRGDLHRLKHCTHPLDAEEEIPMGSSKGRVLWSPGHTMGHIMLWLEQEKLLFSGDALFFGGCGRFFEGNAQDFYPALERIRSLPDDTQIFCGHEYTLSNLQFSLWVEPLNTKTRECLEECKLKRAKELPTIPSSVWIEKGVNPFLRWDQKDVISFARKHGASAEAVSVLSVLREQKDHFKG